MLYCVDAASCFAKYMGTRENPPHRERCKKGGWGTWDLQPPLVFLAPYGALGFVFSVSEMVTITWRCDVFPFEYDQLFELSEKKSWKGKMIRGFDVAEMVSDQVWAATGNVPTSVEITAPAYYKGIYTISTRFEPTFSAKRVDNAT